MFPQNLMYGTLEDGNFYGENKVGKRIGGVWVSLGNHLILQEMITEKLMLEQKLEVHEGVNQEEV